MAQKDRFYSGVRILTAALDDCLNETKFIVPGLGPSRETQPLFF